MIRMVRKSAGLSLLALPGFLLIIIFNYVPLYGLLLPFKTYRYNLGIWNSPWVGLDNFGYLFNGDALYRVLRNTILYNMTFIVLGTTLSVIIALLLYELSRRFVKTYQTILFIPYFISWVVAGFAFRSLFDMEYGVVNRLLVSLGEEPIMWYSDPKYWPYIIVIAAVWKGLGYSSVIYYAALMGIDSEYYDAAKIDGASKIRRAISISVPMIKPIIIMLVILQIGSICYSDFGLFYNVTLNSSLLYETTDVIDTFVYRSLIDLGDIGMASAAGFFQSIVGFCLVLVTNAIVKKINPENSLF
ncbi:ABC transporter permease [Paenibacillus sacheonensis]|uniref:ABC transporter permease subunit n=1 Tax=Paenibacillus sacheonensis TaxID=742054 RepID=A0A7X5BVV2_9BACL|nr:ABC transporter permease subunit [Paenibacillus sacheonensis]MBM7565938.1 putative aldouronate transport system permease protein [Paenibacillus sacheonensis]NBC68748.1 ABC transporter permease subunit [Paenibacillus sacheonensis]